MAKRVEPWNPNTADWLVAQRGERTQDAIVAAMAARGVALKRAWLSRIENGAPFSADLLAAFETYYKSVPPPFEGPETTEVPADLIRALTRQTLAIENLVKLLTPLLSDTANGVAARLDALSAVVRGLTEPVLGAEATPPVREETGQ